MFEVTANPFVFAAIVFGAVLIGYGLRTRQIGKCRSRIFSLEREIFSNHGEILELQRDFISLELKITASKDPLIKMKQAVKTDSNERMPDAAFRKKLLGKENAPAKNETLSVVYNNLLCKEA
jgi:hypothetical protein